MPKELLALKTIGKGSNLEDNIAFPFRLGVTEEVISIGTKTTGTVGIIAIKIVVRITNVVTMETINKIGCVINFLTIDQTG